MVELWGLVSSSTQKDKANNSAFRNSRNRMTSGKNDLLVLFERRRAQASVNAPGCCFLVDNQGDHAAVEALRAALLPNLNARTSQAYLQMHSNSNQHRRD